MLKMDIKRKIAGNISKIKKDEETKDRIYERYWT